jgi:hypothetical protein
MSLNEILARDLSASDNITPKPIYMPFHTFSSPSFITTIS